jgi:acyl carrier protein
MIKDIVLKAVKSVNKELKNKDLKVVSEETILFEKLDSMAILDLILEIEDNIQTEYGKYIQVADDTMMDAIKTPFKTVGTLIEFIEVKVSQ